jgi:chromate reductase
VSILSGFISGFGANHNLRQSLVTVNVPAMPQPEAYIGDVARLLDKAGNITNESTCEFLRKFMDAFAKWVEINNAQ